MRRSEAPLRNQRQQIQHTGLLKDNLFCGAARLFCAFFKGCSLNGKVLTAHEGVLADLAKRSLCLSSSCMAGSVSVGQCVQPQRGGVLLGPEAQVLDTGGLAVVAREAG